MLVAGFKGLSFVRRTEHLKHSDVSERKGPEEGGAITYIDSCVTSVGGTYVEASSCDWLISSVNYSVYPRVYEVQH